MNEEKLKALIADEIEKYLKGNTVKEKIEPLEEGGFSKLLRTLSGTEESIKTIGILTSENPMAKQLTPAENKSLRKELEKDLRALGLGFRKMVGKYGNIENSYFVPNISRGQAVALGQKYNQDSIIFGEKKSAADKDGFEFSLVFTGENKAPTIKASGFIPLDAEESDFYSLFKGRKFRLNF